MTSRTLSASAQTTSLSKAILPIMKVQRCSPTKALFKVITRLARSVAISDDKHQIIVQAQVWGAVNEQQTLAPAITQLKRTLTEIGRKDSLQEAKFSADSGFHSKDNLRFLDDENIDSYMADKGFRSRNPLFQNSQTYQKHQQTRRKQRGRHKTALFTRDDFHFNPQTLSCVCPAGNTLKHDAFAANER
jgi:hypothetical protein